jgi:hypothetical protein
MSRSEREANMKALLGKERYGEILVTELGGRKRDRKKMILDNLERAFQKGTMAYREGTVSYQDGSLEELLGELRPPARPPGMMPRSSDAPHQETPIYPSSLPTGHAGNFNAALLGEGDPTRSLVEFLKMYGSLPSPGSYAIRDLVMESRRWAKRK